MLFKPMKKIILLFLLSCVYLCSSAQIIYITDFGAKPNSKENVIPYLKKALEKAKRYDKCTILFPKGTYQFIPTFKAGYSDQTYIAHELAGFKNLTIDGNGSAFEFHGRTIPFNVTKSENITFKNFSIDYKRPMVTQGEFVLVSDTALHLKIDKKQYPYEIINHKVWYIGDGWRSDMCKYNQLFDQKSGNIIPQTHDDPVGDFYQHSAKEISSGIISFKGPFNWLKKPEISNIITMYNYIYAANTFQFDQCRNIEIDNVTIYHGGSLAVYARATANIHINKLAIVARKSKGRLFSNMADGIHLKGCTGQINIENCEYNGSGDDFVNVHNMYAAVEEKYAANKARIRSFKGFHFAAGDSIWHIDHQSGQKIANNKIKSIKLINGNDWKGIFEVEFDKDIPDLKGGDLIESAKWLPTVRINNNRVLKRHRGTGIRVTTPKKVIIENNYFSTAGHAILIEGDLDGWLESGAVADMVIRNNTFENCMTSGSVTGGRWEWGEAIIDITPSIKPKDEQAIPFHQNIIITGNRFLYFDYPILRARSVSNLQFTNNVLTRTYVQQPYTIIKTNFFLEGCKKVLIKDNKFSKDFLGKTITTTFMNKQDISIGADQALKWETDGRKIADKLEW